MSKNKYNLPQFERILMRPERLLELGKPIYFPNWDCFCCHDSGFVNHLLVKLIIPGYDRDRDLLPVCQKPGCEIGAKIGNNSKIYSSLDWRFEPHICQELDEIHRQEWRDEKHLLIEKLKDLAEQKSLRKVGRSGLEEDRAQQNHRIERDRY